MTKDSVWQRFRRNKVLVALTFLLAQIVADMTKTLVQSLAPALIKSYDYIMYNGSQLGNLSVSSGAQSDGRITERWLFNESLTNVSSGNATTDLGVYYCEKYSAEPRCISSHNITQIISPMIGYLVCLGAFLHVIINPVVSIICDKIGHRLPFMFGAVIQMAASFIFLLTWSTPFLFVARATQAIAHLLMSIGGLMMVGEIFVDAAERAKVLMATIASGYPIAAMMSFFLGNTGYQVSGPSLPFGILAALSFVDALLRFVIDTSPREPSLIELEEINETDKGLNGNRSVKSGVKEAALTEPAETTPVLSKQKKGNARETLDLIAEKTSAQKGVNEATVGEQITPLLSKQKKGTYAAYLTDWFIIVPILMTMIETFAFDLTTSTAPNWVTNSLQGEQYQLGIVLGVASAAHLITNIATAMFVTKNTMWIFIFSAFMAQTLGLVIYPLCTNVWFTMGPEIILRCAHGIAVGIVSSFISEVAACNYNGESAKAFSLYIAAITFGAGLGALLGGLLLSLIPFSVLYFSTACLTVIAGFGAFYIRTFNRKDKPV